MMGFKMKITHSTGIFGKKTEVEITNPTPLSTEKELVELVAAFSHKTLKDSSKEKAEEKQVEKTEPLEIEDVEPEAYGEAPPVTVGEILSSKLEALKEPETKRNNTVDLIPHKEYGEGMNAPVAVSCRECGHEATQFARVGYRFTKCGGCGEKLFLQPVDVDARGVADDEGFAFDAIYRYLSPQERYEYNQQKMQDA